jgi:large conductance mechanosensitive channel
MGLLKEFREFALKGNVIDLAVGVIIGGAFGSITQSLIKDVIMPTIGIAAKVDFSNLYIGLNERVRDDAATRPSMTLDQARAEGPVLAYGNFITTVINFIILAFCIFMMIKLMNAARRRFDKQQAEAPPPPPPEPTKSEVLLTEIRDLLKAKQE